MATDIERMLRLVTERVGTRLPESIQAESVMQDEEGHVYLRLAIAVHRDIINEIGYYAHPDVSVDVAAAMAALTQLARGKAIMAASLITAGTIAAELSDGDRLDEENLDAVNMAALMLRECLRNYSASYNRARAERLKKRDGSEQAADGERT